MLMAKGARLDFRTGDKQAKGPDQHALATECVSHAAVQRSSERRGEQICSDHPGEIGKSPSDPAIAGRAAAMMA